MVSKIYTPEVIESMGTVASASVLTLFQPL